MHNDELNLSKIKAPSNMTMIIRDTDTDAEVSAKVEAFSDNPTGTIRAMCVAMFDLLEKLGVKK